MNSVRFLAISPRWGWDTRKGELGRV